MTSSNCASVARAAGVATLTLAFSLGAIAQEEAETQPPDTADNFEEEGVGLDRISVTGTRVRRVDVEGALPVAVISPEAIDLSGETSVSDVIRNLTFNSFGSEATQVAP